MQRSLPKWILRNSLWLSILLHLLLLFSFLLYVRYSPEKEKPSPHHYVPAYVYKGAIQPKQQTIAQKSQPQRPQTSTKQKEHENVEEQVIDIPKTPQPTAPKHKAGRKRSLLASSFQILQQQQMEHIQAALEDAEPIYLVGDVNEVADPLIKLIGRALSRHFEYPKVAGELGIRGRVLISMVLHPDGNFTDVTIVKSSMNDDLDAAALYAVNNAPVISEIHYYLHAPKRFVVGFIFK